MQADAAMPGSPLATVCFGLGIVALIYAWRRTVVASHGRWATPDCTRARVSQARLRIEQIQGEEWMAKRAGALMISRQSTGLSAAERMQIRILSNKAGTD